MSFDDNCTPVASTEIPLDAYADLDEQIALFDLLPELTDAGSNHFGTVIEQNAAWLQEKSRSSLSIILQLFPDSVRRMKDVLEMEVQIGPYLWEAGYTPRGAEDWTTTWHWLEGSPLTHLQETQNASVTESPMTTEGFASGWDCIREA